MSSFAIRNIVVNGSVASTSTSTGAIVCAGGFGISGNITIGGNVSTGGTLSGSTLSTSSTLTLIDGLNTGTISQSGLELTFSSSGNQIAIAPNNRLLFKNDNTTQPTAYIAREIVDECELHTYVHNVANPTNLRYMLSTTFPMNQVSSGISSLATAVGNTYAYPVRLVKGQVVTGAGFFIEGSGTRSVGYSLYRTYDASYVRVATTATNTNAISANGMNYFNYSAAYTVPITGIYYTSVYVNAIGTSLTLASCPITIAYINYGNTTGITGVLNKAAQRSQTAGGPPLTMAGLTTVPLASVAYSVVYTS